MIDAGPRPLGLTFAGRANRAAAALVIIGLGLAWRLAPLALPSFLHKYGGWVLWGAMVHFILAALAPPGASTRAVGAVAITLAMGVEGVRLIHTPGLDAFRLTLLGALLLGRIFSGWDIVAYAIGIGLSAWADGRFAACPGDGARNVQSTR